MKKVAFFTLIILTAELLQSTLFARSFFGVAPDLLLVVVISFALLEGPTTGAMAGFSAGLLRDLLLDAPKGITGLAYLIVGYVVGSVRPYVQSMSVFVPVAGILGGSLFGSALYEILRALLGQQSLSFGRQLRVVLLTAVYNTLLTPFVYPVIRKVVETYNREKVYRW
ncbi:MAG: rod shape-determining protein MreD [Actinomycetota bacterium]|nr:rod shape-determining protein MreD [Actinomycetota bacterium]